MENRKSQIMKFDEKIPYENISFDAIGILYCIFYKVIPLKFDVELLSKNCEDDKEHIYNTLCELEKNGFLKRSKPEKCENFYKIIFEFLRDRDKDED